MLKAVYASGFKAYSLSSGKTQPEFVVEAQKNNRSLKHNEEYKNRLELLQNFDFSVSSQKVVISPDTQYIAATGLYPPEVRVYDTQQLGLKFVRRFDQEVVDFLFLSDDYKKLVFLQENRTLEFHTQGGRHHRIRIPKEGRAIKYSPDNAELYIVGSSPQVYRLDLEQGQFVEPFDSYLDEINCCFVNSQLPLLAVGGTEGSLEFYDRRLAKSVATLCCSQYGDDTQNTSVTAGQFSPDGKQMAVGLSDGIVCVYDIRSSRPLCTKNHRNDEAIRSIEWLSVRSMINDIEDNEHINQIDRCIASSDKYSIKLWDPTHNYTLASVESSSLISDNKENKTLMIHGCTFYPNSGLCFVPCEQKRIGMCYIPSIGLAPKWCSFLDSITEELEIKQSTSTSDNAPQKDLENIYDDYKFVTKIELEQMCVSQLIGTPLLRPYMHGYFMDASLYKEIRQISEPFAYEKYRQQKIKDKVKSKERMRISINKQPKVNIDMAKRLEKVASTENYKGISSKKKKLAAHAKNILTDDRFKNIFSDPNFALEEVEVDKS